MIMLRVSRRRFDIKSPTCGMPKTKVLYAKIIYPL